MSSCCFQNALMKTGLLSEGSRICVINGTVRQLDRVSLQLIMRYPECTLTLYLFVRTQTFHQISCFCISCAFIRFHVLHFLSLSELEML